MRRSCAAVAAIIIAAALVSSLAAAPAAASIIYYTDFEELPLEMATLGGVCRWSGGVVTCSDNDMGTGGVSYYLYIVDISALVGMWISTKVRLPNAPSASVCYGIALLSSDMNKAYIAVIDGYNGWVYILSWNVEVPYGWTSIGHYMTGMSSIPNYDPTKWYIASLEYHVEYGAVNMYFQVSDTNGDVLAEVWANSYFANNAFYPAYIGFVVDDGDATFDYLLAATAPTSLPVATVTSTVTSPVYVTETVTETTATETTVTETVTATTTTTTTLLHNVTTTVTSTTTMFNTTTVTAPQTVTNTITVTTTTTETYTTTKTQTVTTTSSSTTTAAPYPSIPSSWLLPAMLILIVLAIIGVIKMASKSIAMQSTTFVKKK